AVYKGKLGGTFEPVLENQKSPADIGWDKKRSRVLVPHFMENTVEAYDIKYGVFGNSALARAASSTADISARTTSSRNGRPTIWTARGRPSLSFSNSAARLSTRSSSSVRLVSSRRTRVTGTTPAGRLRTL